jgi:hypothetical protein
MLRWTTRCWMWRLGSVGKRMRLVRVLRVRMDSAGGVGVADGGGDAGWRARDRRMRRPDRRTAMWQMSSAWMPGLRGRRLRRGRLLLGKRYGLSVGRSRARVLSVEAIAAGAIVEVEIVVGGIEVVVEGTRVFVRHRLDETRADGILGWIPCGSGLHLEERGQVLRMMSLWI